jgi:hypothetical protein
MTRAPASVQSAQPLLYPYATPVGRDSRSIMTAAARASAAIYDSPGRMLVSSAANLPRATSLVEQLNDASANFKIKTNNFAMHFGRDWQQRFFAQLGAILDADEWDETDEIITEAAFTTLLRILLILRGKRRPGLGVGPNGSIVAAWTNGPNRLTLECRPNDEVRWIISQIVDGKRDTAAGQTTLSHLFQRLAPYNPEQWFTDERRQAPR